MRHEILFAVSLSLTLIAAVSASAQRVTDRMTSPGAGLLAPSKSDLWSPRMHTLLRTPSLVQQRVASVDTTRGDPECPMPILLPDSTREFAGIKGDALRSSDRMPMRVSSCVNRLNKAPQVRDH
jgi:hypothetical protein